MRDPQAEMTKDWVPELDPHWRATHRDADEESADAGSGLTYEQAIERDRASRNNGLPSESGIIPEGEK